MRTSAVLILGVMAALCADTVKPTAKKPTPAQNPPAPGKPVAAKPSQTSADVILRAMKDELERSKTLSLASLDPPYFIEYSVEDVQVFSVSATLGGLFSTNQNRFRVPRVRVRVGKYDFDNTNYVYTDFFSGTRYDSDQLPLDDDYLALRRSFWLATDRSYKTAVEAIGRKRAALKNVTQNESLADLWQVKPTVRVIPTSHVLEAPEKWTARVKQLSRVFNSYPEVLTSGVSFDASSSVYYLHNSEGTTVRKPESLFYVQIRASGQTADGMTIRDAMLIPRLNSAAFPSDAELAESAGEVAKNIKQLSAAPLGESYSGPVLVEGIAAAQMVAEVLGPHFSLTRRPVAEPGRPLPFRPSEFEGRIGSRVLPEFLDVVDDPSQTSWNGIPLFGHYDVDEEGVMPQTVTLIEKGKLSGFVLSRQPVKGAQVSNGHARLPGPFGARSATVSNLFVKSTETTPSADLKKKLLQMVKDRDKPYGIIIRKMDFPTSAPPDELRRLMTAASQSGSRPVSAPVLVFKVFADGREELVRGLRFRALNTKSFRDVTAASDQSFAFHYMNNLAPMGVMGPGYVAPTSVVAPSLLFEDMELERPQDDMPKPPIVSPPALSSSR